MAGFTVTFDEQTPAWPAGPKHFDTPPYTYHVRRNGELVITEEGSSYKLHVPADQWTPPVVDDP
jgi:hypothetical protein